MQPPSAAFSAYTGGARRVTPPEAGSARASPPRSRSRFPARSSNVARRWVHVNVRGDRRACASRPRPRRVRASSLQYLSIGRLAALVPSPPAAAQVLHRHGRQGGLSGEPIHPACSPAAHVGNARIDRRRAFPPRASLAASRGARLLWRASIRATAPAGSLSFALFRCRASNPPPSDGCRARLGARRAFPGRDSPSPENDPFPPLRRPSRRSAAGTTSLSAFARCTATTSAPTTPSWLSSFGSETPSSPRNRCARDPNPPARSPRPSPDATFAFSRAKLARRSPAPARVPAAPPVAPRHAKAVGDDSYRRRSQVSPLVIRRADSRIRGSNFPLSRGVFENSPGITHFSRTPSPIWPNLGTGRIRSALGWHFSRPSEQLPVRLSSTAERTPSLRVPPRFPQVIKNVSTLFYDQPDLLHGRDGLEFFVPKNTSPPQPSQWFSWTPQTHNRFGRTSFRVAVRMLLLCEKRSRNQPPI